MKNKPAQPKKQKSATIPAWECPRCGRTHPITVTTCECGPTNPYRYPFSPKYPEWPYPPVTCTPKPWGF